MSRYEKETIKKIQELRSQGNTYGEITKIIKRAIPKSTLSEWCKKIDLPLNYQEKISRLNKNNLNIGRKIAVEINKIKRQEFFEMLKLKNLPIAKEITNIKTAKIALAMLCLGEASKYNSKTKSPFSLGNSDPRIIIIFLKFLKSCFDFDIKKVRCIVQCRFDQNPDLLKKYWSKTTGIPENLFYKPNIDPRTKGKPTIKENYKGVLRIQYLDTKVQHEIESLSNLIYEEVINKELA